MKGDFHVRFRERLRLKCLGLLDLRGRNRSLISRRQRCRVAEVQTEG